MRKILFVLSLALTIPLLAQTADLRIEQAMLSAQPATAGQRFALNLRWRNLGPDLARNVHVLVTGSPTPFFLVSSATTLWQCSPSVEGTSFLCQYDQLAAGAEAFLILQMLAPSTPGPFTLRVEVRSSEVDPNAANSIAELPLQLAATPATDLSLSPSSQLHRGSAGDDVSVPLMITNRGDHAITSVLTYVNVPLYAPVAFQVSGDGWLCAPLTHGPQAAVCSRNTLGAGQSAPLTITTAMPGDGQDLTIHFRVAAEGHTDSAPANNRGTATMTSAEVVRTWSAILIPLLGPDIPGQDDALWRTEVTGLIASDELLDIHPLQICFFPICPENPPLRTPFNVSESTILATPGVGQFVYLPPADASKLHFNARAYDAARTAETAGAELPIVRDHEFTTSTSSILGIPVAAHYRHMLRIYDLDGRQGGRVNIRIFDESKTTPLVSEILTLAVARTQDEAIDGLPVYPAVLQLDPAQLTSIAGLTRMRIDIEPLDEGLRLWSFVSVTNNETHHVTTFSAQ